MPTITNADSLLQAASNMSTALQGGVAQSLETTDAIEALMKIFKKNAEQAKKAEDDANPQRVQMRKAAEQRVALEKAHEATQETENNARNLLIHGVKVERYQ
jgi:hypothetical protein